LGTISSDGLDGREKIEGESQERLVEAVLSTLQLESDDDHSLLSQELPDHLIDFDSFFSDEEIDGERCYSIVFGDSDLDAHPQLLELQRQQPQHQHQLEEQHPRQQHSHTLLDPPQILQQYPPPEQLQQPLQQPLPLKQNTSQLLEKQQNTQGQFETQQQQKQQNTQGQFETQQQPQPHQSHLQQQSANLEIENDTPTNITVNKTQQTDEPTEKEKSHACEPTRINTTPTTEKEKSQATCEPKTTSTRTKTKSPLTASAPTKPEPNTSKRGLQLAASAPTRRRTVVETDITTPRLPMTTTPTTATPITTSTAETGGLSRSDFARKKGVKYLLNKKKLKKKLIIEEQRKMRTSINLLKNELQETERQKAKLQYEIEKSRKEWNRSYPSEEETIRLNVLSSDWEEKIKQKELALLQKQDEKRARDEQLCCNTIITHLPECEEGNPGISMPVHITHKTHIGYNFSNETLYKIFGKDAIESINQPPDIPDKPLSPTHRRTILGRKKNPSLPYTPPPELPVLRATASETNLDTIKGSSVLESRSTIRRDMMKQKELTYHEFLKSTSADLTQIEVDENENVATGTRSLPDLKLQQRHSSINEKEKEEGENTPKQRKESTYFRAILSKVHDPPPSDSSNDESENSEFKNLKLPATRVESVEDNIANTPLKDEKPKLVDSEVDSITSYLQSNFWGVGLEEQSTEESESSEISESVDDLHSNDSSSKQQKRRHREKLKQKKDQEKRLRKQQKRQEKKLKKNQKRYRKIESSRI